MVPESHGETSYSNYNGTQDTTAGSRMFLNKSVVSVKHNNNLLVSFKTK